MTGIAAKLQPKKSLVINDLAEDGYPTLAPDGTSLLFI